MADFPRDAKLPPTSAAPIAPRCCLAEQNEGSVQQLLGDADFWRAMCPQLHVADAATQARFEPLQLGAAERDALTERVAREGFYQLQQLPALAALHAPLALGVVQLAQHGWPPSFIFAFDEAWGLVRHAAALMRETTGAENRPNYDVLAWLVDPNAAGGAGVGFGMHRDRQPDDVAGSFRADGTPKYATCWLPVTDACPDNSCLYVLPRDADPGYAGGDLPRGPPPLARAFAEGGDGVAQRIRCLLQPAGGAVVFSHRTLHWGSRGRAGFHTPRIALSAAFSDGGFEPAYLRPGAVKAFPALALRVALVAAQMIAYQENFGTGEVPLRLFLRLFAARREDFEAGYHAKVVDEFAGAYMAFQQQLPGDDELLALFEEEEEDDGGGEGSGEEDGGFHFDEEEWGGAGPVEAGEARKEEMEVGGAGDVEEEEEEEEGGQGAKKKPRKR